MRSLCAEPSYPEPLPQLTGNLAANDAALHPNCAVTQAPVYHGVSDDLTPEPACPPYHPALIKAAPTTPE
jgi:hypothetical protein